MSEAKNESSGEAANLERLVKLKTAVGITQANCSTCCHLGTEGDGYEYNGSWLVCSKIERMGYLKSFPFKKEMPCWSPDFWHSKFTDMIKTGSDEELAASFRAFHAACDGVA